MLSDIPSPLLLCEIFFRKKPPTFIVEFVYKLCGNEFFKDFQDTSKSSDDNTNVVNDPKSLSLLIRTLFEKSSPSPLHIDHCCHECGDSLVGIFCRQCTFPDGEGISVLQLFHRVFTSSASVWESRTDNQEKDEKQSQNDKTGLGMEKTVKDKAKSKPESQSSQKVNRKNDFKHTLKHKKKELTFVELGIHLRIKESLKVQDSDKPKDNNVVGPSVVNIVEHNNSTRYTNNKGKRKHHDNIRADPNKKAKPTCWKCGKTGHIKRDCKGVNVGSKTNSSDTSGSWNSLVPLKEDIGGSVVPEEVTEEVVVQQPEPELRKGKRN
ncbi:zinc finger, CCHC-type containing protein [Tanacetum coccineum]